MNTKLIIVASSEEELQKKLDWYKEDGWELNHIKEVGSVLFGYCESNLPYEAIEFKRYTTEGEAL